MMIAGLLGAMNPERWIIVALVAALVALFIGHKVEVASLNHTIDNVQAKLDKANEDVGKLQTTNASLSAANQSYKLLVDEQNASIQAAKDDADAREEKRKTDLAALEAKRAQWQASFTQLLNATPPPQEKECEATNLLLKEYFEMRDKEKANESIPTGMADPTTGPFPIPPTVGVRNPDTGHQDSLRSGASDEVGSADTVQGPVSRAADRGPLSGPRFIRADADGSEGTGVVAEVLGGTGDSVAVVRGSGPCGGDPKVDCGSDPNLGPVIPPWPITSPFWMMPS